MTISTKVDHSRRPPKLWRHKSGRWASRRRGRVHYFGTDKVDAGTPRWWPTQQSLNSALKTVKVILPKQRSQGRYTRRRPAVVCGV